VRVTLVSLRPTEAASHRPALTPELLAATGARYSRSNDGLEAILARMDPADAEASVDRIFKFVDYGHASIADMAPVALFIDDVSLWLAYLLWTISPVAGGQESSTRYLRLDRTALVPPSVLGIAEVDRARWLARMDRAFAAYQTALAYWEDVGKRAPERMRIPAGTPPKAVERMRRNFAFDRARYFLPVACATNVMLTMSARAWVGVCQFLLSHPLPEAVACGEAIRAELALVTPRLLRHARALENQAEGLRRERAEARALAVAPHPHVDDLDSPSDAPPTATLEVFPARGADPMVLARDLQLHDNRYAYFGEGLRRTGVRFGWEAMAFAEIRDLNRHRTGTKYCPPDPVGFYGATDEIPDSASLPGGLIDVGRDATRAAREALLRDDPGYVHDLLLGCQFAFEHTTTADKFLYEAELRTGTGAHYRYARHLRDALALWYEIHPETRGLVLEGSAEPE